MSEKPRNTRDTGRRDFLRTAGAGLAAAGALASSAGTAVAGALTEKEKLARIASNTWPARSLFKRRPGGRPPREGALAMKKKYGEITMMDFFFMARSR